MVSNEGGSNVEDPASFFANVFGGERFMDYVRTIPPCSSSSDQCLIDARRIPLQIGEISLMKDMTNVANTMLSDEEKAEVEAASANHVSTSTSTPAPTSRSASPPHPNGPTAQSAPKPTQSTATAAPAAATPGHPSASLHHASSSEDTATAAASTPSPSSSVAAQSSPSPPAGASHPKKRSKMTPEQRAKLEAHDRERKRALEERVKMLTGKLVERLRPFVAAQNPGAPGDAETAAWEARMRRDADDLKLESFGVELLHAIGTVYVTKASSFLKSKKFLGM
jgi:hypothetical protein